MDFNVPNFREKVIDNKLAETYNYICIFAYLRLEIENILFHQILKYCSRSGLYKRNAYGNG